MKGNKIVIIVSASVILLSAILALIFYKPNKKFNFKNEKLEKITLVRLGRESIELNVDKFNEFLEELNELKYKEKATGVKTKGSYFIELKYENETIEIGRYGTQYEVENTYKATLFRESFDEFVKKWINK